MPTAKAQYKGDGSWVLLPEFSDDLRAKLRTFYLTRAEQLQLPREQADEFIDEVLSEARHAKSTKYAQGYEITKSEVKAELQDLFESLRAMRYKLTNLSVSADNMLGVDADPLGCADQITKLLQTEARALTSTDQLKKSKKPRDKQHAVAVELAHGMLKTLKNYNMGIGTTASTDFGTESDVVTVLKLIGEDLGLVLSATSWLRAIGKAKHQKTFRVK